MKVQIFSDVVCPWCYLGVTRFERAAAAFALESGTPVEWTLRAYQLDPDAPSDGRPVSEVLAERFGGEEKSAPIQERLVAKARADGIELDLAAAVRANSFDAHRLLTWATAQGGTAQRDLAQELWRAHFAEGADIADHTTLSARAGAAGFDLGLVDDVLATDAAADEVRLQQETAVSLSITSVPTFVIDGKWMVQGAQPQETFGRVLREVTAAQA